MVTTGAARQEPHRTTTTSGFRFQPTTIPIKKPTESKRCKVSIVHENSKQQHQKDNNADSKWLASLQELKKFKEEHGHTIVPRGYSSNPKLASWVRNEITFAIQTSTSLTISLLYILLFLTGGGATQAISVKKGRY